MLCAASDDVQPGEALLRQPLDALQYEPIAQSQAIDDTAQNLARGFGHGLARLATVKLDLARHVRRVDEHGVIGIDKRAQGWALRHQRPLVLKRDVLALAAPRAPAFLDQPEAGNVFQQAHGTIDAAFVGDIPLQRLLIDDRLRKLGAQKRPGAAAQISEILLPGGDGDHRGGGVVFGYGHHRQRGDAQFLAERGQQDASARSR